MSFRPAGLGREHAERGWKPPRFGKKIGVALAFPNTYGSGMSSLGYQTILFGLAAIPDVRVGRLFLDEKERRLELLDGGLQPLQADLLAFSIASENDYPNVLAMLSLAGIPLRSEERGDGFPLVAAGGIAPSLNPEPLADFVDAVVIGEGEEVLAPIIDAVAGKGKGGRGRERKLEDLAAVPGVYVPSFYRPSYGSDGLLKEKTAEPPAPSRVSRVWVEDLDRYPAASRIMAPGSAFQDLFLVEVNRGCGRGCRFCAAGHMCRPVRHRSTTGLFSAFEESPLPSARIGLLGSAVADHPDILELGRSIVEGGRKLSVSSLRLDRLDRKLLDLLHRGGCRTVTLAPETGSERLRWTIGKRIKDDRILEAVEDTARAGIPNIRLYFMIGLPTETADDREAIVDLLEEVRRSLVAGSRAQKRIGKVRVSVSSFVPKAWTPFQWHPFADLGMLKRAMSSLKRRIRKIPNTTVTSDPPRWSYFQALFSRGDRRAGEMLELAHRLGGDWRKAAREAAVHPDFFVRRQRGKEEVLPWDFIDTGLRKEVLWRQYRSAMENR